MRDSFDRFCDDLMIEILKYLSFNDKFKYECVSKQWKRCVFQRQYSVIVDKCSNYSCYVKKFHNKICITRLNIHYNNNKSESLNALQRILNKFKFINQISLYGYDKNNML
jgi:hypothetical protein